MIASKLKQMAVQFSDTRAFEMVVNRAERRNRNRPLLRVLAYHRIDETDANDPYYPGLISATPSQFAAQIQCVAERYHVCSMQDVVAAAQNQSSLPPDSVLLTFDDATRDFAIHAWPVLKSFDLPATVFVPTAYPDNHNLHFWWDRLYRAVLSAPQDTQIPMPGRGRIVLDSPAKRQQVFRQLKEYLKTIPHSNFQEVMADITGAANVQDPVHNNVLSWNALRALQEDGVTLAPHTHSHPMLNRLPLDEIRHEVQMSCKVLTEEVKQISRTLAYPAGGVSDDAVMAMATEGIDLAFSTQRGLNDQRFSNPFRLQRINVGARTTLGLLRMQLANWGW
ncbi:MAG: polysaccharide deacetylase family protein [Planctomycetota bacterium]|nr:polysaccharide deacetylase family protein [Planctomycetota bacterium]